MKLLCIAACAMLCMHYAIVWVSVMMRNAEICGQGLTPIRMPLANVYVNWHLFSFSGYVRLLLVVISNSELDRFVFCFWSTRARPSELAFNHSFHGWIRCCVIVAFGEFQPTLSPATHLIFRRIIFSLWLREIQWLCFWQMIVFLFVCLFLHIRLTQFGVQVRNGWLRLFPIHAIPKILFPGEFKPTRWTSQRPAIYRIPQTKIHWMNFAVTKSREFHCDSVWDPNPTEI